MGAGTDRIKRYVGAAGSAIAEEWLKLRGQRGEAPPVGGPAVAKPAPLVAGISTGTLLLGLVAYFLLKGRKRG